MKKLRFYGILIGVVAVLALGLAVMSGEYAPAITASTSAATRDAKWAAPVDTAFNLYRVTPTLYRCGQFTKEQAPELRKLGVRTVVDFRHFHSDENLVGGTGIETVSVPAFSWTVGDSFVIAALTAIRRGEALGAVAVHCNHGSDRTGAAIAMYRIIYQGWSREEAIDEMRHGGYHFHWIWVNIAHYIRNADVQKIAAAVEERLAQENSAGAGAALPAGAK